MDVVVRVAYASEWSDFSENNADGVADAVGDACFRTGFASEEVVAKVVEGFATGTVGVTKALREEGYAQFTLEEGPEDVVWESIGWDVSCQTVKWETCDWCQDGRDDGGKTWRCINKVTGHSGLLCPTVIGAGQAT